MIQKKKTIEIVWLLLVLLLLPVLASSQKGIDASKLQLANRYYQEREFQKAAMLFQEIFEFSDSQHYFDNYLNCLVELSDFETAEKAIKKQLRRTNDDANLLVQWGYLLAQQNLFEDAGLKYDEALKKVQNNKSDIIRLAGAFTTRREFEWAEKVYLRGRSILTNEDFNYELARVYMYQRNYDRMLEEYLELLKKDEENLTRVQSSIRSAMRSDVDNSMGDLFRTIVLKKIQADPDVMVYNQLLIWFFIQEDQYKQALRQAVALDKRTGNEERSIVSLAQLAGVNSFYEEAMQAYDYLINKGQGGAHYFESQREKMLLLYRQFTQNAEGALAADILENRFINTLQVVGYFPESVELILNYAHFLGFYQDKADDAIVLLEKGMTIPLLNKELNSQLKNELADIYVYKDDLWEAVLLYSQLIEVNRDNSLGDEVKLKKARLGYYMGNLSWAQAQLDVIKASTSKLVANDALELSIFIRNNTSLDTTEIPMQLFARADLYAFRNQVKKAWGVLDSIEQQYNYHSLLDDVYFRKAKVKMEQRDYLGAATYLEKITQEYAYELLADDALFLLAEIKELHLNQLDEASELYKNILVQHPGSIYVVEARKRYRKLRGDDVQ